MTSTTSIQGEACNRLPFKSDENCDRGSVDIHMFNDIPLCKPIDPTVPAIPPEVVDTPAQLYVPPACTCFNMKYDLRIGYNGRSFYATTDFKAEGDCCEGKYKSDLTLGIPCPVIDAAASVKVDIKQGAAAASAKAYVVGLDPRRACSLVGHAAKLNLNLPCSVNVPGATMTIGTAWGNGGPVTREYASARRNTCDLSLLSPNFNLNIPCPIPDEVRAQVGYSRDGGGDRVILRRSGDCGLVGADISLPCPVTGAAGIKKMRGSVRYAGNPYKHYVPEGPPRRVPGRFEYDPDIDRWVYVDIEQAPGHWEWNIECHQEKRRVSQYEWRMVSVCRPYATNDVSNVSFEYAGVNPDSCTINLKEPTFSLGLPCPVGPHLKEKDECSGCGRGKEIASASSWCEMPNNSIISINLSYINPFAKDKDDKCAPPKPVQSAEAVIMDFNPSSCTMLAHDASFTLGLPCPIKRTPPEESAPKFHVVTGYADSATAGSTSFSHVGFGPSSSPCAVKFNDIKMDLRLPCPVSQDYLKISKKYVSGTAFDVNLVEDGMDGCTRKLRLEVAQPQAGGGGCLEVVTDTRFEEKDGVMSAVNTKTNLCTGIQREDRVDLFSIGDMTVVTDVKYENTQFWQLRSKVKCLRRIEEVGNYISVFQTTPLSQE